MKKKILEGLKLMLKIFLASIGFCAAMIAIAINWNKIENAFSRPQVIVPPNKPAAAISPPVSPPPLTPKVVEKIIPNPEKKPMKLPKIQYGRGFGSDSLSICIQVTVLSYGDKILLETKTKRDLRACSCKSVSFTVEDSQERVDDERHLKVADDDGKIVTTEDVVSDAFLSRARPPITVYVKCTFR